MHRISLIGLLLLSLGAQAAEITIKDNISGLSEAATNSLNNQTAGAGGRQILLTQHAFTQRTQVTRFRLLSSSTAMPVANGFSYSVRNLNTPFAELFSGTATRTSRTAYTDVTLGGNNTNLDEFSIAGLTLDPGTYYFTVHASDGNAYQVAAHSASAGGVEPLLAENGGVPFLAGANFHLYTTLFGIVVVVDGNAAVLDEQKGIAFSTIPTSTALISSTNAFSLSNVNLRLARLQGGDLAIGGGSGINAGEAVEESRLRFWAEGNFVALDRGTTSSFNGYDSDSFAGQLGADYAFTPSLAAGLAFGRVGTDADLVNQLGKTEVDSNHFSVYGQYDNRSGLHANLVYSYDSYDLDLRRNAGSSGTALASPNGRSHSIQAGVGHEFPIGSKWAMGVGARVRYTRINVDGYSETNAGAGSLTVDEQDSDNIAASIGGTLRYDVGRLRPFVSLFYEYNRLDFDNTNISLVVDPSLRSTQSISSNTDDYLSLNAGLDYLITPEALISASYATSFLDSDIDHHGVNVTLSYRF